MWLKSGLRPRTDSRSASRPTGRQLTGTAGTEGKDSGGSDESTGLGYERKKAGGKVS